MRNESNASDRVSVALTPGHRGEGQVVANVLIELRDASGNEIQRREVHNLIVQNGMKELARRVAVKTLSNKYEYMRLGQNSAAAATTDTNVKTYISTSAKTCNTCYMTQARTAIFVGEWTTDLTFSPIKEVGLFNALSTASGTMLARAVFAAVNKGTNDTLKITWTVKVN